MKPKNNPVQGLGLVRHENSHDVNFCQLTEWVEITSTWSMEVQP